MQSITAKEFLEKRATLSYTLIDVRTPEEYQREHLTGAINMPLDYFQDYITELPKYKNIVVYCNTWNSSSQFYKRAEHAWISGIINLSWGISGCIGCNKTKQKWALPMMQQVQITAWALVLFGIVLAKLFHSYTRHEYFIGISAFVGAWLIFAGSTGRCWLAKLLAKLPWNQFRWHKKVTEVRGKDLLIKQFEDKHLAHYSYIAISDGQAMVVDPERDIQKYLDYAAQHNAMITAVYNTHPHADFASGHLELHEKTWATIYVGEKVWAEYPHIPLSWGEEILCGKATIIPYFTPWHSPDSFSFVIKDAAQKELWFFTGDWLFLGDVGRADLRETVGNIKAKQVELAGMMYDTTRNILPTLDGSIVILPAHGAGTSCGKWLSKMNIDTLSHQRIYNPMLQEMSKEDFIMELTSDQPAIPAYFTNSVVLNKRGNRDYADALHNIPHLTSIDTTAIIIDTRSHLLALKYPISPTAINIPHDSNAFVGMIGAIVKPQERYMLIIEKKAEVAAILHAIISIGYEESLVWIYCIEEQMAAPYIIHHSDLVTHASEYTILDVRSASTYKDNNTAINAINIPIEQLRDRIAELDKSTMYVPFCGSTYKSHIAFSLLHSAGYLVRALA